MDPGKKLKTLIILFFSIYGAFASGYLASSSKISWEIPSHTSGYSWN
jgi:hypothetical protein